MPCALFGRPRRARSRFSARSEQNRLRHTRCISAIRCCVATAGINRTNRSRGPTGNRRHPIMKHAARCVRPSRRSGAADKLLALLRCCCVVPVLAAAGRVVLRCGQHHDLAAAASPGKTPERYDESRGRVHARRSGPDRAKRARPITTRTTTTTTTHTLPLGRRLCAETPAVFFRVDPP